MILRYAFALVGVLTTARGAYGTTEWFGDLRAHLNPPSRSAFYDVAYDDSECTGGVQSNVVPEFVYFGQMVGSRAMSAYTDCLHLCLAEKRCRAVNFFESLSANEKGFCELLGESQHDNPRLMRPFRKASYYDRIRCHTADFEDDGSTTANATTTVSTTSTDAVAIASSSEKFSDGTAKLSEFAVAPTTTATVKWPALAEILSTDRNSQMDATLTDFRPVVVGVREAVNVGVMLSDKIAASDELRRSEARLAPTPTQMSRKDVLRRLAAKIREFNQKFTQKH